MTAQTRAVLKSYFQRGLRPVQSNYEDLIDSFALISTSADYVLRSGDTMTGLLVLSGDPVVSAGAATKQYVDSALGAKANAGANTDITSIYLNNTGLKVKDTNATHGLIITPTSNLTADRTLSLSTGDESRTISLTGNLIIGDNTTIDGNAIQADLEAGSSTTKFVTPSSIKYGIGVAKASGTVTFSAGTPSLSAGSFGVTSITDSGTGVTTINLSITMSGTYQVNVTPRGLAVGGAHADTYTANTFVVKTFTESGGSFPAADIDFNFTVFGDLA